MAVNLEIRAPTRQPFPLWDDASLTCQSRWSERVAGTPWGHHKKYLSCSWPHTESSPLFGDKAEQLKSTRTRFPRTPEALREPLHGAVTALLSCAWAGPACPPGVALPWLMSLVFPGLGSPCPSRSWTGTGNKASHGPAAWRACTPWLHCRSSLLAQVPGSPDFARRSSLYRVFSTQLALVWLGTHPQGGTCDPRSSAGFCG